MLEEIKKSAHLKILSNIEVLKRSIPLDTYWKMEVDEQRKFKKRDRVELKTLEYILTLIEQDL